MTTPFLIAGAGIGGLSTALALAQSGIASTVVERAPAIREVGAGLQLSPNAFRAFSRLGVSEAMDQISFRPRALRLIDSQSAQELSRQTLGAPFEARFIHPYRVAYRADVQQVLLDAVRTLPELVTVRLGHGVKDYRQDDSGVIAILDSGEELRGEALVGADGLWSDVRARMLGRAPPASEGHIAYRALLSADEVPPGLLTDEVQVWVGPGHHLVCYRLRGGRLFNIVAIFESARDLKGWDTAGDPLELERGFEGACDVVLGLIRQIRDWRMWTLHDREPAPRWADGRVVLLGDAAHPMLPYLAQGACMAIEDAVRLADEVAADLTNLPRAFVSYQAARLPRTTSVQQAARETGVVNHARGEARLRRNEGLAKREADDYEAIAWLFTGEAARPDQARGSEIGVFGRHVEAPASL